jgi:DNA-binding response OmpR family regulator
VVIADVRLPGLNGRQMADAGRTVRPELPVIFTGLAGTALDDLPLVESIELLRKPFALDRLMAMVIALRSRTGLATSIRSQAHP